MQHQHELQQQHIPGPDAHAAAADDALVAVAAAVQRRCRGDDGSASATTTAAAPAAPRRRALLLASAATAALGLLPSAALPLGAQAADRPEVEKYLPAMDNDLFKFVPDPKHTPSLRAGTIKPDSPYSFGLPAGFREDNVANILSGNYCQPRCDEPWTEVVFTSPSKGRIVVIVSPLVKLTRKKGATIEDIGTPQGLLQSLGSYITGTFLEEEDVVSAASVKQDDGRVYYQYEINAQSSLGNMPHSFTAATTKGDVAMLMIASANEKQWAASKKQLQAAVASFRA